MSNNPLHVVPRWRRYPVAQFLIALILALITSPITEATSTGELFEAVRLTVLLLSGLIAMGGRKRMLLLGVILSVPALAGKWIDHLRPGGIPDWIFLAPALLFVLLLFWLILRFILRAPRINSEVLCAGVAGYLLIGLAWAFAYIMVASAHPGAFAFTASPAAGDTMKGFTAIYYSYITLCTIGYGDIAPVFGIARMLAVMEGIIGTLYMAILVARLVGGYSESIREPAAGERSEP